MAKKSNNNTVPELEAQRQAAYLAQQQTPAAGALLA